MSSSTNNRCVTAALKNFRCGFRERSVTNFMSEARPKGEASLKFVAKRADETAGNLIKRLLSLLPFLSHPKERGNRAKERIVSHILLANGR
jgi:hypothetical protein